MSARHRISTAVRQSPVDVEARLRPIVDTAPGAAAALHWRCALLGSGTVSTADAPAALLARVASEAQAECGSGLQVLQRDGLHLAVALEPPADDTASGSAWRALALQAAASAIYALHAELRLEQLRRSERLQQALYEIADLASSSLEMRDMLARIHVLVASLMSAENFYIALYDDVHATMRFLYFADQNDPWRPDPDDDIPLSEMPNSLTAALLRHGQPVMGPSDTIRAQLDVPRDGNQGPESADWLGVPVRREARVAGAIVVQSYNRPDSYTHEDRALLEALDELPGHLEAALRCDWSAAADGLTEATRPK